MNTFTTLKLKTYRGKFAGVLLLFVLMVSAVNSFSQCSTPTYCNGNVTNVANYGIGIANVTLGSGINNTTSATGAGPNYFDFTNLSVFASAGSTVSLSVTNGPSNSTGILMYIDYNQDGTFGTSAPELVWSSSTTTASATVTGSFVIPSGQSLGSYRIRVTGDYGGAISYNPCQLNYGEVEDYTLIIGNASPNVSAISSLPTTFAVGNNTVICTAKNLSTTTVTSMNFGYNCTNGQSVTPSTLTGLSIASGATYTYTFATALSLTAGSYTLKIWANNPNGTNPDANVCGDTITLNACTGMSGSFTINPTGSGSTNFTSFGAAATKLATCGVAGPVTITVAAGTYNEQMILPSIAGASATNTVVFDGVDTATRTISFSTGSNTAVIELNGAKYVTIKNLNISNTLASSPFSTFYGVHMRNSANYNTIKGCKISMANTSPPYYYAVPLGICGNNYYDAGDNGNNNLVDGNRLIGGYISMALLGNSSLPMCVGNTISNNKMEDAYQYGMYINYQGNFTIDHNVLNMNNSMTSSYGIYAYYLSTTNITRNIVNASYYGILFYTYSYYAPSGNCSISNNILRNISTSSYYTGLYLNNGINTTVAHNTVVTTAASGNALLSYFSYSGNKINNNILVATQSGTYPFYIANASTSYFTSVDYNTIVAPTGSANYAYWGGSTVASVSALKNLTTSFNQNNNDVQPVFQSTTNLHLSTAVDQARGIAGLGINIDIDGDARCVFAPSIGADESGYITAPPTAGYTVGTVYVNSPVTFLNNYSALLPMSHKWYVDGVLQSTAVNFTRMFTATGNYNICLKSTNCSGSDSTCTTITVTTPTTPPFSDFIADKSVVNTFQNVNFTDLSSNGPSTWLWSVNPGTAGVDYVFTSGTTAASQNPVIYFTNSGNYNVCMKASNVAGGGNNRCKTNYIVVQAASSMCIFPFNTNVAVGNLYSSGGPNGGYGNNENCTYVIDACADSTFLKVTSASFGTGTVDRFEIYEGDYFPGKTVRASFVASATYTLPVTIGVKGKMTVREVTDATSNNGTGIKANWFITNGTFAPPTGTIVGSSNAYFCASGIYNYYSSSFRDPSYTYDWDFDNDGIIDFSGMDGYFAFSATGPDTIKLKIAGCGGILNVAKFVNIIAPPVPTPSFTSNLFTATSVDTVQLIDNSTGGVISWKWTITGPGAVNYVGGTGNTSRSPKVMAVIAGNYNVKLVVTNCTGSDSTTVTSQFKILGYCVPTAGNLLPDLTISKFQMGSINNTVTTPLPGTVAYRDFSQVASTNTDRGATYTFTITRTSNYNAAGIKIWVDWNQDGTFSTSELAASTVTGNMTWTSTLFTPKTATLGATRLRIGIAYNNLTNTPCGANIYGEFQDFRVIVRPDVTAPVLTLGGSNPTYVEIGRNFVETGDVAMDAVDGNVTDSVTYLGYITGFGYQMPITKQTTAVGTYTVTVDAEDLSDNHSTLTRTVIVTADTTKPVITLNGTNPMFVEVYNTFVDPGAVATDFYFTTALTVNSTNNVDVAHLGSYTVTYTATDINGNVAKPVTRTVIVRDTQKPVINFPANTDTVYVEVRSNYSDAGATVTDNYNLNLVAAWTGSVNTYVPGTYYYTFTATDASGNSAIPRVRVIIVRDHTAPELVLAAPAAPDTLVLDAKAYSVVPEPGYVATDNYYPVSQITISKSGSVDLNKIGIYTVTYTATDPAGNSSAPQRRIYKLVDRTKPVITINGSNSINVCRWRAYNDAGAIVTDNYYSGLQIVTSSNLDINLPGIYTITYTAVDSSGNAAVPVTRYINVMVETSGNCQAYTGINNNNSNSAISVSPNPTNGMITIEIAFATEKQSEVIIYNSLGQVVRVVDNAMISNAKYNVDLQGEAAGIYFVTVKSENNTITKKFVLNK